MKWPLVWRRTLEAENAYWRNIQGRYEILLQNNRVRLSTMELDMRDLRERNRHLESMLDSTDPYTISRRAAEHGNARAANLVGAIARVNEARRKGEAPDELDLQILERGAKEWGA